MSSSEEKPLPLPLPDEDTTTAQSDSSKPRKLTTVIGVLLIVGVVATVGVCVAVFAPAEHNNSEMTDEDTQGEDLQVREQLYRKVADNAKLARQTRQRPPASNDDCSSEISSDTIPAAHIQGRRGQFTIEQHPRLSATAIPGYQSLWTCSDRSGRAFVDGGMVFNHSDKALHVPKCGYYYVSSQVYFHVTREDLATQTRMKSTAVNHQIHVDPNCGLDNRADYLVAGYSSLGPFRSSNDRPQDDFVETSSYVGEIFKLCTGGKIWVVIPEANPCCPQGNPRWVTFLGAFLVSETNCNWPLQN